MTDSGSSDPDFDDPPTHDPDREDSTAELDLDDSNTDPDEESSLPVCPWCGVPIVQLSIRHPEEAYADPCGCLVAVDELESE